MKAYRFSANKGWESITVDDKPGGGGLSALLAERGFTKAAGLGKEFNEIVELWERGDEEKWIAVVDFPSTNFSRLVLIDGLDNCVAFAAAIKPYVRLLQMSI